MDPPRVAEDMNSEGLLWCYLKDGDFCWLWWDLSWCLYFMGENCSSSKLDILIGVLFSLMGDYSSTISLSILLYNFNYKVFMGFWGFGVLGFWGVVGGSGW